MKLCDSETDLLNCLFEGDSNKITRQHLLNQNSSRSHCVFTITLIQRNKFDSYEKITVSKINLIDLAGSERTKKTSSDSLELQEAGYINKSLSLLEQMILQILENPRGHISYRQSKLNLILKDTIGANSNTIMVANIIPENSFLDETISTLKFSTRMNKITNKVQLNVHLDSSMLVKTLK